ncbi:zinc ribbon domain-containing protein [Desulfohalobiaceae bacterium Ax17]|jgi:putative FmdB family regulatory protein|uniref:FmdB family zinc ribbon protein n=1 Tax=Desulfovulcanus ferrireducens TaxID=2831190 RepID=UPI00207BA245|nr:zinc ribbon domain-containing protein [Desulfovulcanus ferrireducens]MBT8764278.1 zinc ribbon domain-containing protein [Desulfovulcanus ferrireducens]
MPIYEYYCYDCRKIQELITFRVSQEIEAKCPQCGGTRMKKLISRARVKLSEETRLERLADPSKWGDFDENDPRSMAKMIKKMGSEIGEDFDPAEVDQALEEAMGTEGLDDSGTGVASGDSDDDS